MKLGKQNQRRKKHAWSKGGFSYEYGHSTFVIFFGSKWQLAAFFSHFDSFPEQGITGQGWASECAADMYLCIHLSARQRRMQLCTMTGESRKSRGTNFARASKERQCRKPPLVKSSPILTAITKWYLVGSSTLYSAYPARHG
jgi:DNA-binding transcriptional regulator of glucitol operon